jgi:GT2 family glycosyltransferase
MLSIIICSKQADISDSLKSNIKETIGVPYELIVIDNSRNEYSIFEAYNEGVKKASYQFLCFMHEDVWYHSPDWGKSVINHLSDTKIGLIGLAGAYYLLSTPSCWSSAKHLYMNVIQGNPINQTTKYCNVFEDKEVISVDGFWFCSRKDVFKNVSFDTLTYSGFHFYDMDISLQIHKKGYQIYVIADIIVEHQSNGSQNSQWIESAYIFYNKWEGQLPACIYPDFKISKRNKMSAFKDLLYAHKLNHHPISKETLKIGWKQLSFNIVTAYILLGIHIIKHTNSVESLK